jgi:hypothetical protein
LGSWDLFYLYYTSTIPKGVQAKRAHPYQGAQRSWGLYGRSAVSSGTLPARRKYEMKIPGLHDKHCDGVMLSIYPVFFNLHCLFRVVSSCRSSIPRYPY